MKPFFVIFVLLLVVGYGAMTLDVIGIVLLAAGVLAAVIALQINQYFLQERIEKTGQAAGRPRRWGCSAC